MTTDDGTEIPPRSWSMDHKKRHVRDATSVRPGVPPGRQGAVRIVRETKKPTARVARDLGLGVCEQTLGNWVQRDRVERGESEGLTGDERAELARCGLDMGLTISQTGSMTVKIGISLPDATHARALEHARSVGITLSGLVDAALKTELTRRELTDHMAMLAEADDVDRLRERARARSSALSGWKTGR